MSYDTKEKGVYTSNPIELFKFEGSFTGSPLCYTSGDDTITYDGVDYGPAMITRGQLRLATEPRSDNLSIRVPRDNPVALLWLELPPQSSVWLTIFRKHRDDAEVLMVWKGRVRGVAWAGSEAVLECEPLVGLLKRPCLRATFQIMCNHQLYDGRCGINAENGMDPDGIYYKNPANHPDPAEITLIVGKKYYSNSFRADWINPGNPEPYMDFFTAGYAVDLLTGERRFITLHIGGQVPSYIELWQPFSAVDVGSEIDVYAGCKRTHDVCYEKFDHLHYFGGFPVMPLINPFLRWVT